MDALRINKVWEHAMSDIGKAQLTKDRQRLSGKMIIPSAVSAFVNLAIGWTIVVLLIQGKSEWTEHALLAAGYTLTAGGLAWLLTATLIPNTTIRVAEFIDGTAPDARAFTVRNVLIRSAGLLLWTADAARHLAGWLGSPSVLTHNRATPTKADAILEDPVTNVILATRGETSVLTRSDSPLFGNSDALAEFHIEDLRRAMDICARLYATNPLGSPVPPELAEQRARDLAEAHSYLASLRARREGPGL